MGGSDLPLPPYYYVLTPWAPKAHVYTMGRRPTGGRLHMPFSGMSEVELERLQTAMSSTWASRLRIATMMFRT
jgi:hypothetical protein